MGTLVWAMIVLVREKALDGRRWYIYEQMLFVMAEDYWAWLAIVLVVTGLYRLLIKATPHWYGAIGYVLMMMFWVYLAASLFTPAAQLNPSSPAATGAISVMAFLSVFAAASNARRREDAD